MFLGYEETCKFISDFYSNDNVPPFIKIISVVFVVIIFIISAFISIVFWLIGFWRCDKCSKVYNPIEPKKVTVCSSGGWDGSSWKEYYCNKCEGRPK